MLFFIFRLGILAIDLVSSPSASQQNLQHYSLTHGQIDPPRLPRAEVTTNTATLQLDLVNGDFPQATSAAAVYRAADASLSLSARDRARARATNLGFSTQPEESTASTFKWTENSRTLELDLSNQTFALHRPLNTLTFNNRQEFTRFSPINTITSNFIQRQFQYPDLNYKNPDVQFVNPLGSRFIPQSSNAIQPTNYAMATFTRQPLDGVPIYSSSGKFGPISMVIVPAVKPDSNRRTSQDLQIDQIVRMDNNYIPIQTANPAIYPVITPRAAYQTLSKELGRYLVSVTPTNSEAQPASFMGGRVLFVTLAYLEPNNNNPDFVQPVWMFEGRGTTDVGNAQWVAYVPAIDQAKVNSILLNQ